MNREIPIKAVFSLSDSVEPEIAERAARAVAINVPESSEAALFLDMLGLINPLPGNEPVELNQAQRKQANARNSRIRRREAKKNEVSQQD